MTTVRTRQSRDRVRPGSRKAPGERLPVCAFCRQNIRQVKFVVTDPDNLYNVCEHCMGECVKVISCMCVC